MTPEKEIEVRINGQVQGVKFRDYAKRRADELGVVGYVKNMDDGSVEVVAQGEEKSLGEFARLLKKGPVFSKVEDFEIEWHDDLSDAMTEFTIEKE